MKKNEIQASFFELAFFNSMRKENIEFVIGNLSSGINYSSADNNEYILREIICSIIKDFYTNQFMNRNQSDYINLVKKSLLNYIIDEEFYTILIEENEWGKFKSLVKRNDFKSKLVVEVLNKCKYLISMNHNNSIKEFSKLLEREIKKEAKELENKLIAKDLGDFKKKIDSITGGINIECYKEFIDKINIIREDCCTEVNNYILEKYKYDLLENNHYTYDHISIKPSYKLTEEYLSLLLYDDYEFWGLEDSIYYKSLYKFFNIILKNHPFIYVAKIIDYLFDKLQKNENYTCIIENKSLLYAIDKEYFLNLLGNTVFDYTFCRFKLEFSDDGIDKFQKMLIYPLYNVDKNVIDEGKALFESYIQNTYETKGEDILKLFNNVFTVVQKENTQNKNIQKQEITIESYFDYSIYGNSSIIKKTISAYMNDFFSNDNVLARIYIKVYLFKLIFNNKYISALNELFYDFFEMLEEEKGIVLKIKLDEQIKNNNFNKLKEILKAYDIEIGLNEKAKENYIISLLDRKVATIRQRQKFPELEQLGDSIYNFVVSECLFYNSDIGTKKKFNDKFQEYVCAKAQVKIANFLGLDKLYINFMNINDNSEKLTYSEKVMTDTLDYENYRSTNISLADTLEMIIGSVSIEYGYVEAIELCKKLIVTTYPELNIQKPTLYEAQNDNKLSLEYKQKIFPGPFEIGYIDNDYRLVWKSIEKFLMIECYGNDTIKKRNWIAHNTFNDSLYRFESNSEIIDIRNNMLYAYLYNGIQYVVEMYKKRIYSFNVVNLHFIDMCNLNCKHCFVNKEGRKELSLEEIRLVVDRIDEYFKVFNIKDGRINLAGGEPLASKNIQDIIDYIDSKGISVSIITNGTLLTDEFIEKNKDKIKTIGISVDSTDENTNILIGRCTKDKKVFDIQRLMQICAKIKEVGIKLKINICVSKLNINEDFSQILNTIKPDRLKLLQMTIIEGINCDQKDNCISLDEFHKFCDKYKDYNPIVEDSNSMMDSYLIVDSKGMLSINNSHNDKKSLNILENRIGDVIDKLEISFEKFKERYH